MVTKGGQELEPSSTGSDGSQITGELIPRTSKTDFFVDSIQGLVTSKPRTLNDAAYALLQGWSSEKAAHLESTKQELKNEHARSEHLLEEITKLREENAVLNERLAAETRQKNIRSATVTVGALLLGTPFSIDSASISWPLASLGLFLLVFGWEIFPGKRK